MYCGFGKRIFDLIVVALSSVIVVPMIAFLALLVRWKIGSPVFFHQERPGYLGAPFKIHKFRTMSNTSDSDGNFLPDEKRLSSFGRFLRSTSLDELPELCNVLKGEMSLVGPRPLLMQYLDLYTPEQMRRHEVRPGITGWAQVNGRNALSWQEKFELDTWYVDNVSFLLDVRILLRTVVNVIARRDISYPGEETMPVFTGTVPRD